jgi:1-aminocyclopropane-1-carboxylate deaminase
MRLFVKREDELGFGVSGYKFRKYRTLIPYIRSQGCKQVVLIGGAFSNHIFSLTQLLIENGIRPILLLKGTKPAKETGNFLFLQMLLPPSAFHWIPKEEWKNVHEKAKEYGTFVVPEGASIFQSLVGALTLPLDILRNEEELGLSFDHIFVDTGTGLSAAALLLGLAFLGKKTICHLIHLADTEEAFQQLLKSMHKEFENWMEKSCPFPSNFEAFTSILSPSFGSTNRALFDFIIQTAREEGFLLDPIYSAKLFYHAKKVEGNVLLIHSGGVLTLSGFQPQLLESIHGHSKGACRTR